MIAKEIYAKLFDTNITQLLLCFWVNLVLVNSSCWVFISSLISFLDTSLVENYSQVSPHNVFKTSHFPWSVRQSPPGYWNKVWKRKKHWLQCPMMLSLVNLKWAIYKVMKTRDGGNESIFQLLKGFIGNYVIIKI